MRNFTSMQYNEEGCEESGCRRKVSGADPDQKFDRLTTGAAPKAQKSRGLGQTRIARVLLEHLPSC